MQILRHSKIAVTMEICTEVPSAATRDALKKLGSGSAASRVAVLQCCTGIKNGQPHDRNWPVSWVGGRYWDRTSDLLGVNEALSR
jgi:hypothetical protein